MTPSTSRSQLVNCLDPLLATECLTSLFKFQDASTLIAEAHQHVPLGSVCLVYLDIHKGEKHINGLVKQIEVFTEGHLGNQQVSETFVDDFLLIFVDPQLIQAATFCEWDIKTQPLLTPSKLAEYSNSVDLVEQGWWKDVVEQFEEKKQDTSGKRMHLTKPCLT